MNKIKLLLGIFILITFMGCGGGSSEEIDLDPQPISEKAFSLWVMQENKCNVLKGVMDATVLVYDESPSQNPQADFTTYTTGENGLIELDLDLGSQVSFTVIASADQPLGKVNIIRSFIDVDVDNYVVPIFTGSYTLEDSDCQCQSATITAEIAQLDNPEELVTHVTLDWNRLHDPYSSWSTDGGATAIYRAQEICGEDSDSPLVFGALTAIGCADCLHEFKFGILENPTIDKLNEVIPLNMVSETVPKPEHLEDFWLSHARYLDGTYYLKAASNWGIRTLDEVDLGSHYYEISREVEGSYNGQSNLGVIYRYSYQDSSDMALIGDAPLETPIVANYNEAEQSYSISAQGSEDYDFKYFYSRFVDEDYNATLWAIYSPNVQNAFVPRLPAEIEQAIAASSYVSRTFRITDVDDASDYSSALKEAELKRHPFSGVSRKSYYMRFIEEDTKSNSSILKLLEQLESEF
ncbi:hypothetical protein [Aliikangiella sp. IMCC44632]